MNWVFQQDGATPHTANILIKFIKNNFDFYLPKEKWPANSPDLKPLDYYYWNRVIFFMDSSFCTNHDELKDQIKKAMQKINKEKIKEIKSALKSFTSRVKSVETAEGHNCHFLSL